VNKSVLIFDVNNLATRAFHAFGSKLTKDEVSTGTLFGVLRDIKSLIREFGTERVAFCFDHPKSKREEIYPAYKANRKQRPNFTPEDRIAKEALREEIEKLRTNHLPRLGYRNIFQQEGLEADDLIAAVVNGTNQSNIIVSSDKDLYQLLYGRRTMIWRPALGTTPGKLITEMIFEKEYGIASSAWAKVKALAGCSSDNIQGVQGVGELRAIQYLKGDLGEHTLAWKAIERFKQTEQYKLNKTLVRLPFPGTQPCPLVDDKRNRQAWDDLCREFSFSSLREL
jgi:DNA polymerase-1